MVAAALCAGLLSRCGAPRDPPDANGPATEIEARVLEVTDGDTIVVRLAGGEVERVRYIGVDTPESTPDQPLECFGHEAAEANRRLVCGRTVVLLPGVERRDDYGRLLAWVWAGRVEVNAFLLRRGYRAHPDHRAERLAGAALRTNRGSGRARRGRSLGSLQRVTLASHLLI